MFCDEEKPDDPLQKPSRIVLSNIAGNSFAGGSSDARTDLLDRHHERVAEQHRPGNGKAELSARLAVGRYPTRIVVRRFCDEPWSEQMRPRFRRPAVPPFIPSRGGRHCHVKNSGGERGGDCTTRKPTIGTLAIPEAGDGQSPDGSVPPRSLAAAGSAGATPQVFHESKSASKASCSGGRVSRGVKMLQGVLRGSGAASGGRNFWP